MVAGSRSTTGTGWARYGVVDRVDGGSRILNVDDEAVVLLLGEFDDDGVSAGPDVRPLRLRTERRSTPMRDLRA